MKKITFIACLTIFTLTSCLTQNEKELITAQVQFVSDRAQMNFTMDSIQEATNFKIRIHRIFPESEWDYQTSIHMGGWRHQWNQPYKIEKDRNLTFESYMSYCEAMNLDPKDYIQVLSR